jgi:tetratricopeptide (TPR) repeat protein
MRNPTRGLVAALACLALGVAAGRAQDAAAWQRQIDEARRLYQEKGPEKGPAAAEPVLQAALIEAEKFGPEDPRVAVTLHDLANLNAVAGNGDRAEEQYRRAIGILEKLRGPDHLQVALVRLGLADLYAAQTRVAQAEPLYQGCLAAFEKAGGPDHPAVATVLERYADLLSRVKRDDEAGRLAERARTIRAKQAQAAKH